MSLEDKAYYIINTYKPLFQIKYISTEFWEFQEAVNDYEKGIGDIKHVIEEMGDVLLMLKEFQEYYEIHNEELLEVMEYKSSREVGKIKEKKCAITS